LNNATIIDRRYRRRSIAERNIDVARGLNHFAMRRNESQSIHRIGDRDVTHLIILVADHGTEMSFVCKLHGFDAEARAQNAIERGRWTAALQMSKHTGARFFSSAFGNLARDDVANSAESKFAAVNVALDLLSVFWSRAFSDDDERCETSSRIASLDGVGDFVVIERDFRNQNNICPAGDSAVKRDPTGVAAHDFDNHHALM